MNCGCVKHLGCYVPGDTIDFGLVAPCDGVVEFQIFNSNGSFQSIEQEVVTGDALTLPFTFNENADTVIKIRVPECAAVPGWAFFTTDDGACSWSVSGMIPHC